MKTSVPTRSPGPSMKCMSEKKPVTGGCWAARVDLQARNARTSNATRRLVMSVGGAAQTDLRLTFQRNRHGRKGGRCVGWLNSFLSPESENALASVRAFQFA